MTTTAGPHRAAGPGGRFRRPADGAPASRLRLPPRIAQAAIALGAVAVLVLWWTDTTAVVSAGAWITDAGRLLGLLAGYGTAVLLLLMARIPAVDRGVGTDRLARWHSFGGRYTVGLVVGHILLITWGYAVTAHQGLLGEGVDLVLHYPDLLIGSIGVLLLFLVGLVSAGAVRRRVRYETWYYLHLLTYLAIYLTFWHQLANGAQFVLDDKARAGWYLLYAGSGLLLLWFRWLVPGRRALRHRLRVAEVRTEAPGVVSVLLTGRHLAELARITEPGQFYRWRFLAPGLAWSANPYSLSAPADERFLRITVKELGGHSAAVARLAPGTRVLAEGPYGGFTAGRRRQAKVLLLAGGVGITPLRALFETLPAGPGELTLLYRASSEHDLVFRAELEAISRDRGARLRYLLGSRDEEPLDARTLMELLPDVREHDVYLCGPPGMTDLAHEALAAAGVPRRNVHHESFAF
jgi:ferredoxin-NADP reductase